MKRPPKATSMEHAFTLADIHPGHHHLFEMCVPACADLVADPISHRMHNSGSFELSQLAGETAVALGDVCKDLQSHFDRKVSRGHIVSEFIFPDGSRVNSDHSYGFGFHKPTGKILVGTNHATCMTRSAPCHTKLHTQ